MRRSFSPGPTCRTHVARALLLAMSLLMVGCRESEDQAKGASASPSPTAAASVPTGVPHTAKPSATASPSAIPVTPMASPSAVTNASAAPSPTAAFALSSPGPSASQPADATAACSGYRWPTKIGADADVGAIGATSESEALDTPTLHKPAKPLPQSGRVAPVETTIYHLRNLQLTEIYLEHDRDYHLIATAADGRQLTLESVDPSCAASSHFLSQISAVRAYIKAHIPVSGRLASPISISVTGLGFFDPPGSGGFELHPLLSICSGKDCSL